MKNSIKKALFMVLCSMISLPTQPMQEALKRVPGPVKKAAAVVAAGAAIWGLYSYMRSSNEQREPLLPARRDLPAGYVSSSSAVRSLAAQWGIAHNENAQLPDSPVIGPLPSNFVHSHEAVEHLIIGDPNQNSIPAPASSAVQALELIVDESEQREAAQLALPVAVAAVEPQAIAPAIAADQAQVRAPLRAVVIEENRSCWWSIKNLFNGLYARMKQSVSRLINRGNHRPAAG